VVFEAREKLAEEFVDALAGLFLYMVVRIPKGLAAKANGIGRAIARPSIAHVEAL
jgi:hypothetical protein